MRARSARGDRLGGVGSHVGGGTRPAHPSRDGAGQRIDVGFQWGVVFFVIGGVVADDNHHWHPGAAGVVQVGQAVAQSGAQVQQHPAGRSAMRA